MAMTGNDAFVLLPLPPKSSDLTPCDFYLWGYIKGFEYAPLSKSVGSED